MLTPKKLGSSTSQKKPSKPENTNEQTTEEWKIDNW
jgi:hypothetical protein